MAQQVKEQGLNDSQAALLLAQVTQYSYHCDHSDSATLLHYRPWSTMACLKSLWLSTRLAWLASLTPLLTNQGASSQVRVL